MKQSELHIAAELEGNLTTLDNLLHGLAHSTSHQVALSVNEPDDGQLIGDGNDLLIDREELVAWLRTRRDNYALALQNLGIELSA